MSFDLNKLLRLVIEKKAQELHLRSSLPPSLGMNRELRPCNLPPLSVHDVRNYLRLIAPPPAFQEFQQTRRCDFGLPFEGVHFLVTASVEGTTALLRLRVVPPTRAEAPDSPEPGSASGS